MIALFFQRKPLEQIGSLDVSNHPVADHVYVGDRLFILRRHDVESRRLIYVEAVVMRVEMLGPVLKAPVRIEQPEEAPARPNGEGPPRLSEAAPSTSWDD